MRSVLRRRLAAAVFLTSLASAPALAAPCETHLYPAAKLTSVGEDFDQVKRVGQDIAMYDQLAGRKLDWLLPARQAELAQLKPLGRIIGLETAGFTAHDPLSRMQAADPARAPAAMTGCVLEVSTPQLIMERGGLSGRSFRMFGVVRHYEDGKLVHRFAGFSSTPMDNFRMKSPADADLATRQVEAGYAESLRLLMAQALVSFKK